MQKFCSFILIQLFIIGSLCAQDIDFILPMKKQKTLNADLVKQIVQNNYKMLSLSNCDTKIYKSVRGEEYILVKQNKLMYSVSFVLIKLSGSELEVIDDNYHPSTNEFELYDSSNEVLDSRNTSVDYLFDTECNNVSSAVSAVNIVSDWATRQNYVVQKLIGTNASVNTIKNAITSNNLIAMGNVGHGCPNGIYLRGGLLDYTWFKSQNLSNKVFYFNSCKVHNEPLKSAIMLEGKARTFIGGKVNLPIGASEKVFKNFWNSVLNNGMKMGQALSLGETNNNLIGYHRLSGDPGIIKLTTKGTLKGNEVWMYATSLNGDLTLPTRQKLTIKSGANVNLNGHHILMNGGTLEIEQGGIVNYKAVIRNSDNSIAAYSHTIQQALDRANTSHVVEVRGSQSLPADLIVGTGKTLRIPSGASLNLNNHAVKAFSGSIIIESGANVNYKGLVKNSSGTVRGLYSTIQSGIDNAGTNQTLEVVAGNFNESLAITGKSRVKINGKGKGITIINSPVEFTNSEYCNLTNMTIKNDYAIIVNGGTRPNVSFVEFFECYDMANIYDVATFVFSGNSNNQGTYGHSPEFGVDAYRSTGDIYGCEIEDFDVFLNSTQNSSVTVTENYFCHNYIDLNAGGGGQIFTQHCTYSKTPPKSFMGNVSYSGGGTYCGAVAKPPIQVTSLAKTTDDLTDLKEVNRVMAEIMSSVSKRYELAGAKGEDTRVNELKGVIGVYRDILREKNDNAHVKAILGKLSHCYRFIGNNTEFDNLVGSMLKEKKYSPSKPEIKRYLIGKAIRENDYSLGLKIADEILEEKNIENGLAAEMLYEKGIIYKHYMKDIAAAKEVYKRLAENYPESRLAGFVKYDLKEGCKSFGKENGEENKEEAGEKFTVGNYPNPFNPVTRISYSLPERGMVSVKVYDMLGQEVATLVNEIKESGQYQVTFDASKLSSGLYIYTVTSGKYSATKKMLLIK